MEAIEVFREQLRAWGASVTPDAEESLCEYARMLSGYDEANVIGTKDFDRILLQHILDSLSCLLFRPIKMAAGVADVGSGGGLPGIPLAIMLPGASFSLFEATGKKAAFLRLAAERLGLRHVEVVNARVERAAHDLGRRGTYDLCTVRAVASLSVLAEYCLPLLKVGGHVVAMKGHVTEQELREGERALGVLGGRVVESVEVPLLPGLEQKSRRLVVIEKSVETADAYPRRIGLPAKNPLGRK